MKTLIIIAIIYCVYKIIRTSADRTDEENQAVRAEEERTRIILEQTRIKEEIRADRERAKEMTRRQIESERQRLAWQQRQDKINRQAQLDRERLAKEQAKQAEQLKRHEFVIRDLQYRMKACEEDHKAIMQKLENLNALHVIESRNMEAAERAGDDNRKAAALRKIITLDSQIAAAEKKERKIRYDWNTAKKKLSA